MIILGVDPGLVATGAVVVEKSDANLTFLCLREIKTRSVNALPERLKEIYLSLENIIQEYQPSVMVLEKIYSHHRHPATLAVLGEARGVIILAAALKGLDIVEFPAKYVKRSITSQGSASKEQVRRMVNHLCNLDKPIQSQHLADALALVITYVHTLK